MAVTLLIHNVFKKNSLSDSTVNLLRSIYYKFHRTSLCVATLVTIPCETLRSENERQSQTNAVINDKVQSTVATYLRCGGFSITK